MKSSFEKSVMRNFHKRIKRLGLVKFVRSKKEMSELNAQRISED